MEQIEYPETYRNCCSIPHWICSIGICVTFFIVSIYGLFMSLFFPEVTESLYSVGASVLQTRIGGSSLSIIFIIACSLLAYGIAHDWALALLSWIIMAILLWKVHLILLVCSFVYILIKINGPTITDWLRISAICSFQVLWLIFIIMIGRHWYAICEEIYAQEYGGVPRSLRSTRNRYDRSARTDRRMLMSNRSRVSATHRLNRPVDDRYIYNRPNRL